MPEATKATERERDLARRILAREDGENMKSDGLAAALMQVLDRLSSHVGRLVGQVGYEVLLRRALHLAASDWPFLKSIPVRVSAEEVGLPGLAESVRDQDPTVVRRCLVEILANLVWLLVTFIGEDVGSRLIQQVLGETSPHSGDRGSEGTA